MAHPDRRLFLGSAAALTAASTLAPAFTADEPVSVGFVGVGNRGSALLKSILTLPNVRVTAICDTNPKAIETAAALVTKAGQPAPFTTAKWGELLERKDVGAVVSAIPIDL
ncbi:MAG: gfo/Idh/MocA family oxidoreductase, partial [Gemmataceae bacterium]